MKMLRNQVANFRFLGKKAAWQIPLAPEVQSLKIGPVLGRKCR
jgi:hypothetical protein